MDPKRTASALLVLLFVSSSLLPLVPAAAPGDGEGTDGTGGTGETSSAGHRNGPLAAEDAQVQYAILTSPTFVTQFQRLADWKTDKGVLAKVYTTDFATANYPGRDPRAQYHAFLVDLYNWTHGGLRYVLIGGDDEIVRARDIWTGIKQGWSPLYSGEWAYSDAYYAGLEHDWDANGNGRYGELGEEDWTPEVAVGRLPVSTAPEAAAVVDKVLDYERSPEVGDWMRQAVLAGSVMNPPNANETTGNPEDEIYKWWEDNAWESIERTLPIIPANMGKTVLYDYDQIEGGNYTPENDTLNRSSYIGAINAGASIVVSTTHGYIPTGNGLPHYNGNGVGYNWSRLLYYTDISALTNGNMTPFIYFSSCYVGNFTELDDSNFERLVTKAPGGAIGIVAPTENTYRGEEIGTFSDGNWWMSETFWAHLLGDMPRFGDAFTAMKAEYIPHLRAVGSNPDVPYYRQNLACYNLLADPEEPVWLDLPKPLSLVLPQSIYDLPYSVPVRVMSGALPVAGARVCLRGEDFYAFADSNATGWAVLSIDPIAEGQSLRVTATAPGYLYTQQNMGITPAPAELLLLPGTVRAGRVRPEAGVPTQLGAEVRNIGHADAPSFEVQFYDGDPAHGGAAIGPVVDVPGLPAGATAPVSTTWTAPAAGWHTVWVIVDSRNEVAEIIEDDNIGNSTIYVSALNAVVRQVKVRGGSPTAAVPLGVESTIDVEVSSAGSLALPPMRVRMYLGDPGAGGVAIGADRSTPAIPAGERRTVPFPFTPAMTGTFKLVAVADPTDEVAEFDETDNVGSLWVKVAQTPFWDPIPDVLMVEDVEKQLDLTRYVHDYDTDVRNVTLSVVSVSTQQVTVRIQGTQGMVVTLTPYPDWSGELDVEVQADDTDFKVPTQFHVVVSARNDAPRFRNVEHDATLHEGVPWHYQLDAYDPDGGNVSFTDNSEHFDVSAAGAVDWTPTWEQIQAGSIHVVRFIATDGLAQTYYAMTITLVANNTPPVLRLPARLMLLEGEPFTYTVRAADREGDPLAYSVGFGKGRTLFDVIPMTGQIMFTPTSGMVGEHTVTITVTDGTTAVNGSMVLEVIGVDGGGGMSSTVGYALLAIELAIVVVGLLYFVYHRNRRSREANARMAEAQGGTRRAGLAGKEGREGPPEPPEGAAPSDEPMEEDDED
jgi:hypothetical protein